MTTINRDGGPIDECNEGGNYDRKVMRLRADVRRLSRELTISLIYANRMLARRMLSDLPSD